MGKPKLFKFAALRDMDRVFEKDSSMRGRWRSGVFGNEGPVILELACGKGEYTLGLARIYPDRNFIGVDIKGNRIWSAATRAGQAGLDNVAFLRAQIDHITEYFAAGEVDEIWITFPDPYLKPSRWKKRLTAPAFLDRYRAVLKPGARVHLKTDNQVLYDFTRGVVSSQGLRVLHDIKDIYAANSSHLVHDIQTYYEQMHLAKGLAIKYICFEPGTA